MAKKTINLRDLPEDLVRRAKACAALHGLTLKGFIAQAIEQAIEKDIPTRLSALAIFEQARRTHKTGRRRKIRK